MTTEKPLFSPQRQRNQDNVAASVQRQQELCDLQKARVESKELHLNTLDEHNRQKAQALEDKRDAMASRGIVGNSVQSLVDTLNTSFGHDGQTEAEVFRDSVKDLTDSQRDALALRQEIADDRIELDEQKQKLNEEQARQLRSEKNAINKEQKAERKELAQLNEQKEAADASGEDTTAIDDDIAASNQKLAKLDDAKAANTAAASAHQAQNTNTANSVTEDCPNNVCHSHDLVVTCKHNGRKAEVPPNRSVAELQVLSTTYNNTSTSGRDTITAYVGGACNKGLTTISADSNLAGVLSRNQNGLHCPHVMVSGGSPATDIDLPGTSGAPLKFHVYSPPLPWADGFISAPSWAAVLKHLVFAKQEDKYSTYTVEAKSCSGAGTNTLAMVSAFSKEQWKVEFGFEWNKIDASASDDTKESLDTEGENQVEVTEAIALGQWKINGSFSGIVDDRKFSQELQLPDFLNTLLQNLTHVNYFFNLISNDKDGGTSDGSTADSSDDKIVSFDWAKPKVSFSAEYQNKEAANFSIDSEYKFAATLDPLFGVTGKVDCLQALIYLAANFVAPGSGAGAKKFLSFVKKALVKAEKNMSKGSNKVEFKACLELTAELVFAGELSCTRAYGGQPLTTVQEGTLAEAAPAVEQSAAAELGGVLKAGMKGEVSVGVEHSNSFFEAKAGAGAALLVGGKGGGTSDFTVKTILERANGAFDFKGEVDFKGLILFFMSYATASVKKAETADDDGDDWAMPAGDDLEYDDAPADDTPVADDGDDYKGQSLREVWTIFNPWTKPFWEG